MEKKYEKLLSPFKIGDVEIKNRFCMAPMQLVGIMGPDGEYNEEGRAYFEERAKGGFGLLFTGINMTDMEIDPFDKKEGFAAMKAPTKYLRNSMELIERLNAYDCKMFPQITVGLGRNNIGSYAPSEIPYTFDPAHKAPALSTEQVKRKIELTINTAAFMKQCGFKGVEIHSIHWGYLLDQFAMSLMNHREDEYGGTLENRLRITKEIVEGIKSVCGSKFAVSMRLGLKTYIQDFNKASLFGENEAGRTIEEGVEICKYLEKFGYDCLSVDAGVYDSFYYAAPPCYMPKGHVIDLAAKAKAAVKIPILCGSRMNDADMAEKAIEEGKIDAVVMGRPSLADPHFPKKVEMGRPEKIRPCIACNQGCVGNLFLGGRSGCAVNPAAGREASFAIAKAMEPKKVVVVGGGVAGMEAACTLTRRGHKVALYEKSGALGGNLIPAGKHEFKKEMIELNEWYKGEIKDLGVEVNLNKAVSADDVKAMKPDAVVLAVGSSSVVPKLPGIDNAKVSTSIDVLTGKKEVGNNVVVVGGGLVGCEMAYEYAKNGKNVTLVEALGAILSAGEPVPIMNSMMLNDLLSYYKVKVMTGHKLLSVDDEGVTVEGAEGTKKVAADSVVLAIGFKPLASMAKDLMEAGIEIYQVGDGNKVGNVYTSITSAYTVARGI